MASQLDKEQIQLLLTTGVDRESWPHEAVVLCVLQKENNVVFRKVYENVPKSGSSDGVHAELVMLNDTAFQNHFKEGQKNIEIFLVSNYSPCGNCANKLGQFYDKNKKYLKTFTIRFSVAFRVNKEEQPIGLANLKAAGVILESMTQESWFDLLI